MNLSDVPEPYFGRICSDLPSLPYFELKTQLINQLNWTKMEVKLERIFLACGDFELPSNYDLLNNQMFAN